MKLFIDTTDRNNTNIAVIKNGESLVTKKVLDKNTTPESLLNLINNGLKELDMELKDIKEIGVKRGPGSFTGVRVGISVANALSLALNIPVNDKELSDLEIPEY